MFYFFCIACVFAYALQSTLMVSFYRRMDELSAVSYRGLSLGVTMLPLLAFSAPDAFGRLVHFVPQVAAAGALGILANLYMAKAYRHLPVGISTALSMSFATLTTALLGTVILREHVPAAQMVVAALLLSSILGLGFSARPEQSPPDYSFRLGLLNSLLYGLFIGGSMMFVDILAHEVDPFLAGYAWEFGIGLAGVVVAGLRHLAGGIGMASLPPKSLLKLSLFSAPTVIGTGCYSLALTLGPLAIATAICSTIMAGNSVLAYFVYGEKLSRRQWVFIALTIALIGALKYFE